MNISLEQQAAVDSDAPLIVCQAAAGAGKTRVLVARIQRLVAQGIPASSIAAITYTQKAAQEMQERLLCPWCGHDENEKCSICFGGGYLKIGFCGTLHLFCLRLVRRNHELLGLPAQLTVVDDAVAEQVRDEAVAEQKYKGTLTAVQECMEFGPFVVNKVAVSKDALVAKAYFQKMTDGGLLDFDMILNYAIEAFRRGAKYECQHLLIDEFQDASHLDYEVYSALECDKFVVGDIRQSIFGFRKGSAQYMRLLTLEADAVLPLNGNYRCARSIVESSNRLIDYDNSPHEPAVSLTGMDGSVTVAEFATDAHELLAVAQTIIRNCPGCEGFNDVAVLLRYNSLVERFSNGLRAHGIPVAQRQKQQAPEDWKLAMTLVSFIGNPENDRLALAYLMAKSGPDAVKRAKSEAIAAMCSVNSLFPGSGFQYQLTDLPQIFYDCHLPVATIDAVTALFPGCQTPDDLLLKLHEAQYVEESSGDGVTVTTMHAAKGKEWSTVILPAFEESIIPTKPDDCWEDRRLAYVAMTRAKEQLVLTWARERQPLWGYGKPKPMQRSRFLEEAKLV